VQLYLAINGTTKQEILDNLEDIIQLARNEKELTEKFGAFSPHYKFDGTGFAIDYSWRENKGDAFLCEYFDN